MSERLDGRAVTSTIDTSPIDRAATTPLWFQVAGDLRQGISSGRIPKGSRLPTEAELCESYSVSRITVRRAMAELSSQGLVTMVQGRGTYVSSAPLTAGVRSARTSFSEEMGRMGRRPGSRLISVSLGRATEDVAARLEVEPEDEVVVVKRLRLGDAVPVGVQTAYLPARLAAGLQDMELENRSLYVVLSEHFHLVAVSAVETFRVRGASREEAALLDIRRGDCVFNVERVTRSRSGPFETVDSAMRGDMYEVQLFLRS